MSYRRKMELLRQIEDVATDLGPSGDADPAAIRDFVRELRGLIDQTGQSLEDDLAYAAEEVVTRWASGDLAEAVRHLDAAVDAYRIGDAPAATPRTDRTIFRWTAADADTLAGRELSDADLDAIAKAVANSSAPDAFGDVVFSVAGHSDPDEVDPSLDDHGAPDSQAFNYA